MSNSYKDTMNLPETDFPMRGNMPAREPERLAQWQEMDIYRHVLEKMLECGYAIGGEQSGHTIFREYATTGDGELTALQFLQALRRSGKRASELASCCPQYPQELINVAVSHVPGVKDAVMQDPALRHAIAQMEQELAGKGRVLIRPSGTEALIRVMVEAKTTEVARKVAEDLADLIKILSEKIQF